MSHQEILDAINAHNAAKSALDAWCMDNPDPGAEASEEEIEAHEDRVDAKIEELNLNELSNQRIEAEDAAITWAMDKVRRSANREERAMLEELEAGKRRLPIRRKLVSLSLRILADH